MVIPCPEAGAGSQASRHSWKRSLESQGWGADSWTGGAGGFPRGQGLPGHGCCEHVLSWASPLLWLQKPGLRGPGACPPRSPTCCPGPWEVHQAPEGGKSPLEASPSLIGVMLTLAPRDLQGADTGGPWRWGQVGLVWVSIQQSPALGSQALWTPYRGQVPPLC